MSTKEVTIAGGTFTVSTPYTEGHTLSAAEAKALNQVRCENIRNNTAKKVKEALEKGEDATAIVAEADATYTFSLGGGGGAKRTTDPLEREVLRLARETVKAKIAEKGFKLKDYLASEGGQERYDAAVETVSANNEIVKIAKQNLKQKAAAAAAASADLGV